MYDRSTIHRARGRLSWVSGHKPELLDEARRDYAAARIIHLIHESADGLKLPLTDAHIESINATLRGED